MRLLLLLSLAGCASYRLNYGKTVEDSGDTGATDDTAEDSGADTPWDTDDDWDTDADTDTAEPVPAACARVLVYSTAASGPDRFAALAAEPGLARFDVVVRDGGDGPLTAALLADYSQLWLFGTDAELGSALDFDEVRAVRDFLATNAGLLVAAGPDGADESYADDVALVAELYGVAFEGAHREGADGTATPVTDAAPLLAGVSELPGFSAVPELATSDPAVRIGGQIGGKPAIAYRDDARVVFDRSHLGWTDDWRGVGDQGVLVGNVAEHLEACPP
jgi:hypothetical protein